MRSPAVSWYEHGLAGARGAPTRAQNAASGSSAGLALQLNPSPRAAAARGQHAADAAASVARLDVQASSRPRQSTGHSDSSTWS
ncbi:hypothetical protein ACIA5G_51850 [Amycolatopsis sp. NPDC051758]|uniref:hypothetical protein n=1 Tax=Amycolatopsis sp. NPDC051758 TaxID=3363935 RepID=UPI0037A90D10